MLHQTPLQSYQQKAPQVFHLRVTLETDIYVRNATNISLELPRWKTTQGKQNTNHLLVANAVNISRVRTRSRGTGKFTSRRSDIHVNTARNIAARMPLSGVITFASIYARNTEYIPTLNFRSIAVTTPVVLQRVGAILTDFGRGESTRGTCVTHMARRSTTAKLTGVGVLDERDLRG